MILLYFPLAAVGWGAHQYVLFAQRMLPFALVGLAFLSWAAVRRRRAVPGEPDNDLGALGFRGEED